LVFCFAFLSNPIDRYMMPRLVFLLFALCLAGPAQAQTTQPAAGAKPAKNANSKPAPTSRPTPQAAGPCVGVISLLGDRFIVKKVAPPCSATRTRRFRSTASDSMTSSSSV
jgi:glucose/arabinose dehydrogenase